MSVDLPDGAREGEGVAPPAPFHHTDLSSPSDLPPLNDAFHRLAAATRPGEDLLALARILGLAYFVGEVSATADTTFPHDMGRVPGAIVLSIPLEGGAGRVTGHPAQTPEWTSTEITVRATIAGRYAFLVI